MEKAPHGMFSDMLGRAITDRSGNVSLRPDQTEIDPLWRRMVSESFLSQAEHCGGERRQNRFRDQRGKLGIGTGN